ncbi:hypothetical protein [Edaphosphingomonas haloaromaticamans]|uniref:Uncharacterized protein n=1 Tax=Edaphosphingomonas haloaromaticamans TaxID=653954 RepID=A0A1S1HEX1_9SPHN|nr:hypothetical protein [Sphingomonas haloaromaticamans]OHT20061.1 hypothetical protein BHE75_02055 [Sphingomonas haloaromaticamans]
MFKMFPPTFLVVPVAWLTVLVLAGLDAITPALSGLGITPKVTWAILVVQLIITLAIVTPFWRVIWRWCPKLNEWIFPDLNGEWDVIGHTNWNRIDALLKAAKGDAALIDMRTGSEDALPPLGKFQMRARISQSWLDIEMELWNPQGAGPIQESTTLVVEPIRGKRGRHALAYIFEQVNQTDVVSDDAKFRGAVWVTRDRDDPNALCGRMWSDRMWRRGMNTAADLRFTRSVAQEGGR